MKEKGYESKIVIEGSATKLIPELEKADNFLHKLWKKVKKAGLVDGVCKACANKMGALDAAKGSHKNNLAF